LEISDHWYPGRLHGLVAHQQDIEQDIDGAGVGPHPRLNEKGGDRMGLRLRDLVGQGNALGYIP